MSVSTAEKESHQMIDQANPDHTGSHMIVVAQSTVVKEVIIIGFNLLTQASMIEYFSVCPWLSIIFIYSTKSIEFPTTIQAKAMTPIMEVALK